MRKIALQLYTVRESAKKDFIGVIKEVASIGYAGVEGGGDMGGLSAKDLRHLLDDLGLTFVSGHLSMANIASGFDQLVADYKTLGAAYMGVAWIGEEWRTDQDSFKRAAAEMEKAAEIANRAGIKFFYHNHDFEFKKVGGVNGLDILFDNSTLNSELDLYWVAKGGEDPVAYLRKLTGRVPLVHVKDMTKDAARTFEIVGEGQLDYDTILPAADAAGVDWFIVEQDLCPKGELASARKSFENIVARGWKGK
jgi:sugar phosphate isomerase/epimerase